MFSGTASPASLIYARLSFKQILLILSYVHLESSLLASIGNMGQIKDLLAREEEDWNPHIGEESYPDMIHKDWSETSWETHRAWREICQYMIQQNLIDSTVTDLDLREILGQLLLQIERISAQGFNVVSNRRTASDMPEVPFSEKGILALICMSVSVTTTPGGSVSLRALLADPRQAIMKELCSKLPASPLFRKGVFLYELQDAFKSLEELFLSLSGFSNIIDEEPDAGSLERDRAPSMATTRRETWTYEVQEGISPLRGQSSGPRHTQEAVLGRGAPGVSKLPKRRKRTSLGTAKDDKNKTPLRIQY